MFHLCLFVLCFVSTAVFTAVVIEEPQDLCSELEFRCGDGSCISLARFCDGQRDCADGDDEASCYSGTVLDSLVRKTRQVGRCNQCQWQCSDGSCIPFHGKCDGVVNCPDGSDETFPLCRNSRCQPNWFRCTYGACVDGTAPCNGVQDCADNSDELLPLCKNEIAEAGGQFKCQSGGYIPSALLCDGAANCPDASDETVGACAGVTCPAYLFQCAYGACVDSGSNCNGIRECYDGSDEFEELCNITATQTDYPFRPTEETPLTSGDCVLPPYPKNGHYISINKPYAAPGQALNNVMLKVNCNPGYDVLGLKRIISCYNGVWYGEITDCLRLCRLDKDPTVDYRCILDGNAVGDRECNLLEPEGTRVRPECKTPNYYQPSTLNNMRCNPNGKWSYIAKCLPGITKNGTNITILIKDDKQYEVHVGTYQYTVGSEGLNVDNSNTPTADVVPNILNVPQPVTSNPEFQQITPVTPADADSNIDETDWRIGF